MQPATIMQDENHIFVDDHSIEVPVSLRDVQTDLMSAVTKLHIEDDWGGWGSVKEIVPTYDDPSGPPVGAKFIFPNHTERFVRIDRAPGGKVSARLVPFSAAPPLAHHRLNGDGHAARSSARSRLSRNRAGSLVEVTEQAGLSR